MSGRVSSSPNLLPLSINGPTEDVVGLEGIATNVKLLLKLIQDHQEASNKGTLDDRKTQRFAGMMTILDDVRMRLQKCQFSGKKGLAELRRCSTDLKATISNPPSPRDHSSKKINETLVLDEKEKLRKDLNASYAAQKRLGVMCASLGKEKEIIARELTRKVQELNEMEELVNDLKAQNEKLSTKVQACVAEHKEVKKSSQGSSEVHQAALQQRNRELSEQLVKSLEGYKSLKRKLKEAQDARQGMQVALDGIGEAIEVGIHQIRSLKERFSENSLGEQAIEIKEKIATLESVFKRIEAKVSKYRQQGRQ